MRFHLFRNTSILAPLFGAASVPPFDRIDWELLCRNLPGIGSSADVIGLTEFEHVETFLTCVDRQIAAEVPDLLPDTLMFFNAYDLSCALCLVPGKSSLHKSTYLPFVVRPGAICLEERSESLRQAAREKCTAPPQI